ncbi:MAG TPA: NAD-dependent deacylase [Candidatus Aminicenantes bacterium]|nr:NAD-dependent deacylase [Candidatus Aminicenantes bacterium]HRY65103.1 NAD-dependent deacylase [Candidatus Aminicenantes bacterium]HRZ72016.1 NAD-dependent deacylase [Candidatus Aminicenantes bacterium]
MDEKIRRAARILREARHAIAFTGAGISVESGVPAFRGAQGLWTKYDPKVLEIHYFLENGEECWPSIKEIFYDHFGKAEPNAAHRALARMEQADRLKCVVTQNIDNLHQRAGSRAVYEFHGNSSRLLCLRCGAVVAAGQVDWNDLPPRCPGDRSILKPDFVFFGEAIPAPAAEGAFENADRSDVCLVIGSTGEVTPAAYVPIRAKAKGACIIEVNPEESRFTAEVTDIFLQGKAGEVLRAIERELFGD